MLLEITKIRLALPELLVCTTGAENDFVIDKGATANRFTVSVAVVPATGVSFDVTPPVVLVNTALAPVV